MQLNETIEVIDGNIERALAKSGARHDVSIIAVTKTHPASVVREAVGAGLNLIGENRVQEAETKFAELTDLKFQKHLIGHLQTNKANRAAELFDWVQSLDSVELAGKLSRKASELGKTIRVLIEVKTSREDTKSGIGADGVAGLIDSILALPSLELRGLMTIAPFTRNEKDVRGSFSTLYALFEHLKTAYPPVNWDTLSMGMSDDYEWAIEEGSNMIRLGRVLFGERG